MDQAIRCDEARRARLTTRKSAMLERSGDEDEALQPSRQKVLRDREGDAGRARARHGTRLLVIRRG